MKSKRRALPDRDGESGSGTRHTMSRSSTKHSEYRDTCEMHEHEDDSPTIKQHMLLMAAEYDVAMEHINRLRIKSAMTAKGDMFAMAARGTQL